MNFFPELVSIGILRYLVSVVWVMGRGNEDVARVVEVTVEGTVEAETGIRLDGIPKQDDSPPIGSHALVCQSHPVAFTLYNKGWKSKVGGIYYSRTWPQSSFPSQWLHGKGRKKYVFQLMKNGESSGDYWGRVLLIGVCLLIYTDIPFHLAILSLIKLVSK